MSTIQDVAKLAGVSTATVSRVLNSYAHVSPAVSARVISVGGIAHSRQPACGLTSWTRFADHDSERAGGHGTA